MGRILRAGIHFLFSCISLELAYSRFSISASGTKQTHVTQKNECGVWIGTWEFIMKANLQCEDTSSRRGKDVRERRTQQDGLF